jgi:hypothetical protein
VLAVEIEAGESSSNRVNRARGRQIEFQPGESRSRADESSSDWVQMRQGGTAGLTCSAEERGRCGGLVRWHGGAGTVQRACSAAQRREDNAMGFSGEQAELEERDGAARLSGSVKERDRRGRHVR